MLVQVLGNAGAGRGAGVEPDVESVRADTDLITRSACRVNAINSASSPRVRSVSRATWRYGTTIR